MGIVVDVTPPYWDDYSSHSYPVPNLSISIIKKQETDMFFYEQVSRSTPATLHVLDHSRKSQHARCWSAALSLSTALVLTQRRAKPAAFLPAAVLSLPVVFLAQSPGSLQLSWLGSPQRMSIFPHMGSPGSWGEVSHHPAPHLTETPPPSAGPCAPQAWLACDPQQQQMQHQM